MNWIVFHIAGGQAFFTGAGLTIVGAALGLSERKRRFAALPGLCGVILAAVSATPFPYWEYAVAGGMWVCWKSPCEPPSRVATVGS